MIRVTFSRVSEDIFSTIEIMVRLPRITRNIIAFDRYFI